MNGVTAVIFMGPPVSWTRRRRDYGLPSPMSSGGAPDGLCWATTFQERLMPDALSTVLETTTAERLATRFVFTEALLCHADVFSSFADTRRSPLHRLTPGKPVELVRDHTGEGNGTTFDLQGRLVICEGGNRRVTRWSSGGRSEDPLDRHHGKRLNRPNDVVCKSDGSIWFTDPGLRVPLAEREVPHAGVYRIAPDGKTSLMADCEDPHRLAL